MIFLLFWWLFWLIWVHSVLRYRKFWAGGGVGPPVTTKHILADICCLKMFLLHLQDLKTWGCYGWIASHFARVFGNESGWSDWPFECNIAKFWQQSQAVMVYIYLIRVDQTFQYGLLEAPCWIANEGNFALPSKFMDLEISLFDQEYPPATWEVVRIKKSGFCQFPASNKFFFLSSF